MSDRITCCVPFCRGTRGLRKADAGIMPEEWICSKHWKLVPARLKRLRSAARRVGRKGQAERTYKIDGWLWRECKRAAIEAAGGLR